VSPRPQPPRTWRALVLRRLWLGLAVFAVAAGAILAARHWLIDWDAVAIDAERDRRLALASAGTPLAGTPDLADLPGRLAAQGLSLGAPVFIRIFKREFELELWMKRKERFHLLATYPVCRWSGTLGPKLREGDHQAPEGFYTVDAAALNPASRWHRSFNLGFPNAFDRAHNRTGSFVMVHGGCGSIGCFAMTDPVVDEIWRLVTAALKAGQPRFHVHVFPFRMTEENLASREHQPWVPFWRTLKQGYDAFQTLRLPPRIAVCGGAYSFAPAVPPSDGSHEIAKGCLSLTGGTG
jgi:murein L,D-transpeptidase YafK